MAIQITSFRVPYYQMLDNSQVYLLTIDVVLLILELDKTPRLCYGPKKQRKDSVMGPIKPRREDRVVMSVNIKRSYRDWIDAIVKKQDISKSRFVESMFEVVQNVPPDFMVQLMDLSDKLNLPLSVVIGNTVLWRLIFLTTYQKVYGKPAPSTMQEFYIRKYTITDDKGKKEFQGIPTGEIAGQIFEMVLTEALEKDKEVRDELHATAEKARKRDLKIEDIPIVAEVIDNFLEHAING